MDGEIAMRAIGFVRSGRSAPTNDDWDSIEARIELDGAQFTPNATLSLGDFSYVEVIFHFDRVLAEEIETGARRPRERQDWPLVGIFAQRGKGRPNRIGVSMCRILSVDGLTLHVRALDAIDGKPVFDIKPVMKGFLPRGEVREPEWAAEIMKAYW